MVHSVYSETDIFLRELISNASDACDRLRYEAIAKPELTGRRRAARDPHHAGQGRRHADHRGQRHRHGPAGADRQSRHRRALRHARLHEQARRGEGRHRPDRPVRRRLLFGLHGGGPHRGDEPPRRHRPRPGCGPRPAAPASTSRAADEAQAARVPRGTEIVLHLKDDAKKYLEPHEIRRVVSTYSDHILFPIELTGTRQDEPRRRAQDEPKSEKINSASALWQRPKSELKPEDYKQAYQTIAHAFDDPAMTLHYRAEGRYSYAVLLFAPSTRPFDLFDPARKGHVKLYVRRVYITDDADLLPSYLRFIRGVVDSEDLPLNISREMLQNNPQVVADPQGAHRPRDLGAGKPRREGRRGLRQDLGSVRPGAEGRHLRGFREARAAAQARALRHHRRQGALAQAVCRGPQAEPDRDLLSGRRERRAAQVQSEARSGARPRHRGAAAERSGRCVLDHDAAATSRASRSSR